MRITRSEKDWRFLGRLFAVLLLIEAMVFVMSRWFIGLSLQGTGWMMLLFLFATLYFGSCYFAKKPPAVFLWILLGVVTILEGLLAGASLYVLGLSLQITYVAACLLLIVVLFLANLLAPHGGGMDFGSDADVGIDV